MKRPRRLRSRLPRATVHGGCARHTGEARLFCLFVAASSLAVTACDRHEHGEGRAAGSSAATASPAPSDKSPTELYLPGSSDRVLPGQRPSTNVILAPLGEPSSSRCPSEMVDVAGQFCIDRWEGRLVDGRTHRDLSPYYPPKPRKARELWAIWQSERSLVGPDSAHSIDLPDLGLLAEGSVEPMESSRPNVIPSGYLDGNTAAEACRRASKRLCTKDEWVLACRGEKNQQFPYGDQYVAGACNIFREAHPAVLLHGNASEGHLDPRLNLTSTERGPLLHRTGTTERCKSIWGGDVIYDMVGNLDEWVDDPQGAFQGGFYARATKLGCEARISTHAREYADYSLGVRCCR